MSFSFMNSPEGEPLFSFSLYNITIHQLRAMLRAPGWAKGTKEQRKAFKVSKRFPDLKDPPKASLEWELAICPDLVVLTDAERDMVRKCIKHFSDAGALPNSEFSEQLFDDFPSPE